MHKQSVYSIIQYFDDPDRRESLNVGVVVYDPASGRLSSRFVENYNRLSRVFNGINKKFMSLAFSELATRLDREIRRSPSLETLERFSSLRSNNIRFTPLLPTFSEDVELEASRLFDQLVGTLEKKTRKARVATILKHRLKEMRILEHFDQRPESISLPRYGVVVKADLAIRSRAQYTLVDASRFDTSDEGLTQAGRLALEGRALSSNLGLKLAVVGDFGEQSDDFYDAVKEDLAEANTKLFRLDRLEEFAASYVMH